MRQINGIVNKRGTKVGGLVATVIILVAILAIFYFSFKGNAESSDNSIDVFNENSLEQGSAFESSSYTVEITSSGFSPKDLEIRRGDKVIFVNRDSEEHWPASAIHPTHEVYPGSDIDKCGTDEEGIIFDACHGLAQEEKFEFVFNEIGEWRYHDHLRASMTGSIKVG